MELLLELIGAHKRAAIVAVGVLLALTGLSVARCSVVNSADAPAESAARASAEAKTSKSKGSSKSSAEPTSRQRELEGSYTAQEKSFVERLESCTWVATDGEGTLSFDGGVMTENAGAESEESSTFAVLEIPDVLTESSDDAFTQVALVLDGEGESHVIRTQRTYTDAGAETRLTSDMFDGKAYTNAESAKRMKVEGLDSKRLVDALGGDARAIRKKVRSWCIENDATATRAVWNGFITSDVAGGTETATFNISGDTDDEDSQTAMALVYDTEAKTLEVAAE